MKPGTLQEGATPRRRPYLLIVGFFSGFILLTTGVGGMVFRNRPPDPPAIDATGADPAVARAIELARQRVLKEPRSGKAWGFLGQVLQAHYFLKEADTCLVQAAQLDSDEPRWQYLLFEVRRGSDPDTALPQLARAVELAGASVLSPRLVLGEFLVEKGRLDEAEVHFRRVLQLNPPNPRAHLALGRIGLLRNELDKSLEHLRRAAVGAPGNRHVHTALAEVFHRRGQFKAAQEALRNSAKLADEWVWPNPYLKEVTDLWVGARARIAWAKELDRRGQHQQAIEALLTLQGEYPDSAHAHLALGQLQNARGQAPAAEQALRKAAQLDPKITMIQFQLGYALQTQGKDDEAMQCYRQATLSQPNFAQAHFNMSLILAKRGDLKGAQEALGTALKHQPAFVQAHAELGSLLAQQGRYYAAVSHLVQAAQLEPEDRSIREMLHRALGCLVSVLPIVAP